LVFCSIGEPIYYLNNEGKAELTARKIRYDKKIGSYVVINKKRYIWNERRQLFVQESILKVLKKEV
jgi:hypothetical protein